ncbi:MAG: sodium/glutamate symporter [Marinibacterium sp.]|nr:sodium/glutamate symporter [Marinibacterium sp.]
MTVALPDFLSITTALAVFLSGRLVNQRVALLHRLNIPDPVTGGLLAALAVWAFYLTTGKALSFSLDGRDLLLVLFFTGVGLNVRLRDLRMAGRLLWILPLAMGVIIAMQNAVGFAAAMLFGYPAGAGVLFGSATLIGGHGTAVAWSPAVGRVTEMAGYSELAVAVATLGLIVAALMGGPVAGRLIARHDLKPGQPDAVSVVGLPDDRISQPITAPDLMRVLLILNVSVILGYVAHGLILEMGFKLPLFVPCLVVGVVLGNLRLALAPRAAPVTRTPTLALILDFALGTFLAMSLMSMQLWTLADVWLPILCVVAVQAALAMGFVVFGLFPLLGRSYDAAVLTAGVGGLAMGGTPTAIANMSTVTKHFGPAPLALVTLPLVSAIFMNILNAIVIQILVLP